MKSFALLLLLAWSGFAQTNKPVFKPVFNEDQSQMRINEKVVLDSTKDGFMGLKKILSAPDGKQFLVLACGFECSDNIGFLFQADGTNKRKINVAWDWILDEAVEWSADSRFIYYYRINSTAAEPPRRAPQEGWVQVNAKTGAKAAASSRRLKTSATYGVFRIRDDDPLNLRSTPGMKATVVGKIPYGSKTIQFTGATKPVGKERWVQIKFEEQTGWVNQSYSVQEKYFPREPRRTRRTQSLKIV